MNNNKSFIIGDIHGCRDMLEFMLGKIPWDPLKDNLIFLGDYIDRGNDSKGVLDLLIKIKNVSQNVQFLMGNHEKMFLDYISDVDVETFLFNGGTATLNSYSNNGELDLPPEHYSFLNSLDTMVELEDYYIVHAGFRPDTGVDEQTEIDKLWIREKFIYSDYDFGKKVVFGHTPFSSPLVMANKIGVDTGAVYGNKLTCLELPDEKFHYVEA